MEPGFEEWIHILDIYSYYIGIYILIFGSIIVMVVSFLGCCGALMEHTLALFIVSELLKFYKIYLKRFIYFWYLVHRHPSICLYSKRSRSSYFVRLQYDQFKHSTNDSSYSPLPNYDFRVAIICIYS